MGGTLVFSGTRVPVQTLLDCINEVTRSVVTSSAIDGIRVVFNRRRNSADDIRVRGVRSKVEKV